MHTSYTSRHFPVVGTYLQFLSDVGEKDEIKTGTADNGCKTVSYVVALPDTFDTPHARECRGIVFNTDGLVVSRPLHKFFNLNERPGARPEDFDWSTVVRIMDKRDGSMIHTVNVGLMHSPFRQSPITMGNIADGSGAESMACSFDVKSKKSFGSDVANAARKLLTTLPNYLAFCQEMTDRDLTAVFEFTSPTARIVLPYLHDELTLLHVRDNITGRYLLPAELRLLSDEFRISLVDSPVIELGSTPQEVWAAVQKMAEVTENIEGWIFQFITGEMVKVKTRWYMERHRAMTFLRIRDIHGAVLNESLDDLKAMLVGDGIDISEIVAIETEVGTVLKSMLHEIESIIREFGSMERKDFAMRYGPGCLNHKYFSLLMKAWEGKEPDVKGWYTKHILPDISLQQINLTNSIGEAE